MFTKEPETVCFKRKFLEENKFSTPCFPLITLAEFTDGNFRLSPFLEIAAPAPVHGLNNYAEVFVGIELDLTLDEIGAIIFFLSEKSSVSPIIKLRALLERKPTKNILNMLRIGEYCIESSRQTATFDSLVRYPVMCYDQQAEWTTNEKDAGNSV
ncbi:unnamed protein product [Larinioides sclopetarius]|uniref:Uncharacterized protein n=1 Tax=Larinioides sclopetarius TaxID=280406 RepID=A0AAV1ZYP5_9ARAC